MALIPLSLTRPSMGREFHCPCHGGTRFTVFTSANIPYASCPVCGSVCEPQPEQQLTTYVPGISINSAQR